jgi:hypothetical protein
MFSALIPINVLDFDKKILELVNFEFIPTEAIFEKLNLGMINELGREDIN